MATDPRGGSDNPAMDVMSGNSDVHTGAGDEIVIIIEIAVKSTSDIFVFVAGDSFSRTSAIGSIAIFGGGVDVFTNFNLGGSTTANFDSILLNGTTYAGNIPTAFGANASIIGIVVQINQDT